MEAIQHAAGFERIKRLRTHIGIGVRRHVSRDMVWSFDYDVSEKHSETNLHLT